MTESPDSTLLADVDAIQNRMYRLFKVRERFLRNMAACTGITPPQLSVIIFLKENPGASVAQISQGVDLAKSTVSGIVDRLERDGHLIRTVDPEDRRNIRLFLSPLALETSDKLRRLYRERIAAKLAGYTHLERAQAIAGLEMMTSILQSLDEEGATTK